MKRLLLATLWIGAVAAAVAIVLQTTGLLARPAAFFSKAIGLPPNESVHFGNFLFVIALSFAVAWTTLEVTQAWRRAGLLALLLLELIVAAWVWQAAGSSFPPLPAILASALAAALACGFTATEDGRRRSAIARLFEGRLNQGALDRLAEAGGLDLSEPLTREATLVFCEIANEGELIETVPAAVCAQLTREFNACANACFLQEGGYLHAADGEGVRVLFGFPSATEKHARDASGAALAFQECFRAAALAKLDSLGKIDLRIGLASGVIVATRRDDSPHSEMVVSGEPLEVARRLARVNQIYGSQILLGPKTYCAAGRDIVARPIDFLRSSEAHERLEVYELLALADRATPEEIARRDRFWTAVVYFRERRWNEAFAEFTRARSANGEVDGPLQWYLRRLEPLCLQMATEPAPGPESRASF